MKVNKRNVVRVGRPEKEDEDKKAPNGLTNAQWERFKKIASAKNIPAAMLLSQVAQWYLDGIDRNVSNVDDRKLFDEVMAKEVTTG